MSDYLSEVKNIPKPSEQQISNFTHYVAEAHSWYKHLPKSPPGVPFYFFIDPNAGCQIRLPWFGRPEAVVCEQRSEKMFTHYSWLPTSEYRKQHGHLCYYTTRGTRMINVGWSGTEHTEGYDLKILNSKREWIPVPKKIIEAGGVNLTANVYPGEPGQEKQLQAMQAAIERVLSAIYS